MASETVWLQRAALGGFLSAAVLAGAGAAEVSTDALGEWPRVTSAIAASPALEARIQRILAGMTLEQKVGQMTQPEIRHVTPEQVRRFAIGAVLNGGGSWPQGKKTASAADWAALADQYYDASMATDLPLKVPLIWGTDAMHGHSNVYGSTLFPHNIGLGATRDAPLLEEMGAVVARQVRATGIQWVFAPTVAVAHDVRWGRTYESFSEDASVVRALSRAYVRGLQGRLDADTRVVATAKHYIGDGATHLGQDQGQARVSATQMRDVHAQGYLGAIEAGVQTVMASLSSWKDVGAGVDYGKVHGSRALLTDVLKQKIGFDGFVVTDWDGISQVDGCTVRRCAQAINAGIDMVMVPEEWQAFIANTVAQVRSGEIPLARIDDAVSRILRVKLRAGLFEQRPSKVSVAGKQEHLQARALARRAVRESLVLLKNERSLLPLAVGKRVLVVGKAAHSVAQQSGGWSLTWQGTDTENADFPNADTILDGIRDHGGAAQVHYAPRAEGVDVRQFDVVLAVVGEMPYAEFAGDVALSSTLRHTDRYPEDLELLRQVAGKGVPVATVFLSGRPVYANDLINLSDAFVAAWLPGTEGKGVADLLFRDVQGRVRHGFKGRLAFSWPGAPCQAPLHPGMPGYQPLFAFGHGLDVGAGSSLPVLPVDTQTRSCGQEDAIEIFTLNDRRPYALHVAAGNDLSVLRKVGADLNAELLWPEQQPVIQVQTAQMHQQHDAKRVTWTGPARFLALATQKQNMRGHSRGQGVLQFDMVLHAAPAGIVRLGMECGRPCLGEVDFTPFLKSLPLQEKKTVKIPLMCFEEAGSDFLNTDIPFSVFSDNTLSASFTRIRVVSGAARDADALRCADVGVNLPN